MEPRDRSKAGGGSSKPSHAAADASVDGKSVGQGPQAKLKDISPAMENEPVGAGNTFENISPADEFISSATVGLGPAGTVPAGIEWATPEFLAGIEYEARPIDSSFLQGGSPLATRMGVMTAESTEARPAASANADQGGLLQDGRKLIDRVARKAAVIGGKQMKPEDIKKMQTAVHATKEAYVNGIMSEGLRPSSNQLVNWSSWGRKAAYMFPDVVKAGGLEHRLMVSQGMTELIEIDLTKLDPDKLYLRILDGAVMYLDDKPIPKEALRYAGSLKNNEEKGPQ